MQVQVLKNISLNKNLLNLQKFYPGIRYGPFAPYFAMVPTFSALVIPLEDRCATFARRKKHNIFHSPFFVSPWTFSL